MHILYMKAFEELVNSKKSWKNKTICIVAAYLGSQTSLLLQLLPLLLLFLFWGEVLFCLYLYVRQRRKSSLVNCEKASYIMRIARNFAFD